MSLKSIIGGVLIASTLSVGVGAAVVASQNDRATRATAATNSVKIAGSFNSWTGVAMTLNGDWYTYQRTFALNDQFKVVVNDNDWIGANWEGVTKPTGIGDADDGNGGRNFKVTTAGTYLVKAAKTIGDYDKKGYGVVVERVEYTVTKYAVVNGTKENTPIGTDTVLGGTSYAVPANPSKTGYTFGGWFTNEACTSSYSATTINANTNLYAKFTEDIYKVSVNGGSPVAMSTTDHSQFTASITVNAGDKVTFTKNDSAYSFTPENVTNNNYCSNGFRFGGTFSIYLKTSNAQLWSAGMPTSATSVYYLMVNGIGDGLMSVNPNNNSEVMLTGVHFNQNDKINVLNVYNTSSYTYKNPTLNGSSITGFVQDGNDIKCNTAGYYDLYFNTSSISLYFGESASTACVAFSNAFLKDVGEDICDDQGGTTLSALQAEWVNQYAAWVALGEANQYAQGIMTNKDSSADDELGHCVKLYDYIVGKYGSQLNGTYQGNPFNADFMGRNPTPIGQSSKINPSEQKTLTISVVAIVSVSTVILSMTGLFFLLRKKKHN